MHTVIPHQFQHVAVLRKQRHRRRIFPLEHTFEVFDQSEAGLFYLVDSIIAAKLGPLHKPLGECLHGAQHLGRCGLTHHLEGANGLMKLLPCDAQLTRIQRGQIRPARQLGVPHKSLQGACRTIQRFAQLVQNPGQWPQVTSRHFMGASQGSVCLHGFVRSWRKRDQLVEDQAILNRATD